MGIFAVTAVILIIIFNGKDSAHSTIQDQLETAQKYLDELDYEQAVASYKAIIEIDPYVEEAYIALADIYTVQEDYVSAQNILLEAQAILDSPVIAKKLEEILKVEAVGNTDSNSTGEDIQDSSKSFIPWNEAGLEDHIMEWNDAGLEVRMREITGIQEGDIYLSDVWEIQELSFSRFSGVDPMQKICNIESLTELTNVTQLYLGMNDIVDISALSSLTNLTDLDLSYNKISDTKVLSNLTNLRKR